ncbi:hypothetical protein MTO96_030594, partial [Rhipicephalus appendiculatus]
VTKGICAASAILPDPFII